MYAGWRLNSSKLYSRGRSRVKSVIPSCPYYSTARPDLSSYAVLFSRDITAAAAGGNAVPPLPDSAFRIPNCPPPFPRAHKRLCRGYIRPNATFRRRTIHCPMNQNIISSRQRGTAPQAKVPAVPLRAQTPVPGLNPAKRNVSPAHNSLTHNAEYRFFAPARNSAASESPAAPAQTNAVHAFPRSPIPHFKFRIALRRSPARRNACAGAKTGRHLSPRRREKTPDAKKSRRIRMDAARFVNAITSRRSEQ